MTDTRAFERRPLSRVLIAAARPVDIASLAVFRILFGLLMGGGLVRFMLSGWIEIVYERPTYFFKYPGFEWIAVPSAPVLYGLFSVLAGLAFAVAAGWRYRWTAPAFLAGFLYVQLLDVTNYLNHYYLVVLIFALMSVLPLHGAWSLDARRESSVARREVPTWMVWLLRSQIAVVYIFAALAKAGPDWLLYAQPLNIWLAARTHLPIVGAYLDQLWVAYAMSWAGFLYDLTIVFWLSWRRTRPLAFVAVVVFHVFTRVLFDIGMFPFIMIAASTLFFDPSWPRRFLRSWRGSSRGSLQGGLRSTEVRSMRLSPWGAAAIAVYLLVQVVVPLRHFIHDGDVLWNERGMRYAWKVMVREKNGSVTYYVRSKTNDRQWQVSPHEYLDWRQANEMSGQPDLIFALGRHIGFEARRRGFGPVEVRAEALVSLNGRAPALLVDDSIDLMASPSAPPSWILPAPDGPPARLRPTGALMSRR